MALCGEPDGLGPGSSAGLEGKTVPDSDSERKVGSRSRWRNGPSKCRGGVAVALFYTNALVIDVYE